MQISDAVGILLVVSALLGWGVIVYFLFHPLHVLFDKRTASRLRFGIGDLLGLMFVIQIPLLISRVLGDSMPQYKRPYSVIILMVAFAFLWLGGLYSAVVLDIRKSVQHYLFTILLFPMIILTLLGTMGMTLVMGLNGVVEGNDRNSWLLLIGLYVAMAIVAVAVRWAIRTGGKDSLSKEDAD